MVEHKAFVESKRDLNLSGDTRGKADANTRKCDTAQRLKTPNQREIVMT